MIIKRLTIKNFGKIHNKTLELSPGINVLYGENESGKTTIHTFIKSMFYGITRQRGKAARNDAYTTYEPWENPGEYGGILWFECGGKNYHITSKRFLERATETINVKVYSNCDEITLFVNGEKFNTISGEHTFVFENVKLVDGQNNIKVIATKDGQEFTDFALFNKVNDPNPVYECPDKTGGPVANWFDESLVNLLDGVEITELNITDDVYSTGCTMGELLENEETKAVLAKYLGKMIESPMLGMMKNGSIRDLNKILEGAFDERLVFLLDKDLCQIKK